MRSQDRAFGVFHTLSIVSGTQQLLSEHMQAEVALHLCFLIYLVCAFYAHVHAPMHVVRGTLAQFLDWGHSLNLEVGCQPAWGCRCQCYHTQLVT